MLKKVKLHHKKKAKEAKKLGMNKKPKVDKEPEIPNDAPFTEEEIKALEARRAAKALDQKKPPVNTERVYCMCFKCSNIFVLISNGLRENFTMICFFR